MATLDFTRTIAAPPETVFEVLSDHRGYGDVVSTIRRVELEREGDPAPDGVGAIRAIHAVGPPIREEVIAYDAPRRLGYRMLSGAPLKDHVGTVELTEEGNGTRMSWNLETTPTVPIGGSALVKVVEQVINQMIKGIAKESERRSELDAPRRDS
ncbi:MAG: SRPBCC family protein [Solirubrobacterales bacterium]